MGELSYVIGLILCGLFIFSAASVYYHWPAEGYKSDLE